MKRILATFTGITLAAGLVFASPSDAPKDLVDRYLSATDEAAIAATWKDWHPQAVHSVTIKYGLGQQDERYSYAVADLDALSDWRQDPSLVEAMQGYSETARDTPEITTERVEGGTQVTAVVRVQYVWGDISGSMTQTDEFLIVSQAGRLAISTLDTTLDYQ